jgi:hypothetical protein
VNKQQLELGFWLVLDLCIALTGFTLGFNVAIHILPEQSVVQFQHWLHLDGISAVIMGFVSSWVLPVFWIGWLFTLLELQRRFPEVKSRLTIEVRQYVSASTRFANIGAGALALGGLVGIIVLI